MNLHRTHIVTPKVGDGYSRLCQLEAALAFCHLSRSVRLVPVSRYQEPENRDVSLCQSAVAFLALVGLRFAFGRQQCTGWQQCRACHAEALQK
jgi:hypothetical protein